MLRLANRKDVPVDEAFDAETILREVLEVLRRHGVPAETVALKYSLA